MRIVCLLGILATVAGCHETPLSGDAGARAARPANPDCVARPRPGGDVAVTLERAFPALPARRLVALVQAPGAGPWYAVEQGGRILRIAADGAPVAIVDLRDRVDAGAQEAGLLGLAFHPGFPVVRAAFVSYTARVNGALTSRLSRFTVDAAGDLVPGSEENLLAVAQPFDNHNGGHIAFGPDGYLYLGLGDGGGAGDPLGTGQDTDRLLGKLLRLDVDGGTPYAIPADNPLAAGGGRPEIYAWGLRNPWRFSFDDATGALWLGDVGQDRREEIDRIEAGGNYGWSVREGSLCFAASCDAQGLIDPVLEYDHSEGRSVTGGVVIRDPALPALAGVYVFGDFVSGTIWGAFEDPDTGALTRRTLVDGFGLALSSFARGADGAVYALHYGPDEAAVYRLVAAGPQPDATFPARLSETGCFLPGDPTQPSAGVIPFEVNVPLWSDAADKRRWVALPDSASIEVGADGSWTLPIGTVLIKEFAIAGKRLETRLLMRHDDGSWGGYAYAWNTDDSDAVLVASETLVPSPVGPWRIPSRGQCMQCHTAAAGRVLGFRPAQVARPVELDGQVRDQLDVLDELSLFSGSLAPSRDIAPLPPSDGGAPVADRARGYLDANCAHCHQPGGPGRGSFDLRFSTPASAQRWCNALPTTGDLGIGGARIVAPGEPARSLLLARMDRRGLGQMPPLATEQLDTAGSALIASWIDELSSCPGDWQRTVVLLERQTVPGQNLSLRGGIDHGLAAQRGIDCAAEPLACAVPIAHRVDGVGAGDSLLDWYGAEPGQPAAAIGSPTVWTTDDWPAAWGPRRTVDDDGFGETPVNRWGPHHWMLDVDMDCSRTLDGWFELKAFVNGIGWEPDVAQAGTPVQTRNHWARCGMINRLRWGAGSHETEAIAP